MKNVFKLLSFLLTAILISCGGDSEDEMEIDCSNSNLEVKEISTTVATCETEGTIEVSSEGGTGSVSYSLNGIDFQSSGSFSVSAGTYTVTARDGNNCTATLSLTVNSDGQSISIDQPTSEDSGCGTSNGTLTVSASGGTGDLSYSLNSGASQATGLFQNLSAGTYTITVTDSDDCSSSRNHTVLTGISLADDVMPILAANCFGSSCHNGPRGSSQDWRDESAVINMASRIKSRSVAGTMPPGAAELSQQEKDLISCWVDDGALNN